MPRFDAFRELGAAVAISGGPGHRRSTLDLAAAAGYFPPALALLAAYRARERPATWWSSSPKAPSTASHAGTCHARSFPGIGTSVAIAEGPGHRRSTLDLAAAAGYFPPALALLAAYRARERPAGLHAQDEDAPLGGRHAFDEERVRHSPRRSLRLAQECAALGRHPPEHCGPALAVSESLRDCGWDRGDGRERTDSGAAQAGGRDRIRARPGGGGRHLLPDHADRAVAHRVPNIGGRLRRNCRGKYPANRRKAGFRGDAV